MLKIKRLKLENFRGIRQPLTIDFLKGKQFTSAVILGRNGTGKSSITDGWEWFSTLDIAALKKENVNPKDFCHRSSKGVNVYVEAEFEHASISILKVDFDPGRISIPKRTTGYESYKDYCRYPNYLRFTDLQSFVYKTKKEKYIYIAKYFGLEHFTKIQSDLASFVNKLKVKYEEFKRGNEEAKTTLIGLLGKQNFEEADILNTLNAICIRHNIQRINSFGESKIVNEQLKKIIADNPQIGELLYWKQAQAKSEQLYPIDLDKLKLNQLEELFTELKSDAEQIAKLVLLGLYDKSIEVLKTQRDPTKCPVCDNIFLGGLLEHVEQKHLHLKGLADKKRHFDNLRDSLHNFFSILYSKATNFINDIEISNESEYALFAEDLKQIILEIPETLTILQKDINDINSLKISALPLIEKINRIDYYREWFTETTTDNINRLSNDQKSNTLANDHETVISLIKDYFKFSLTIKKMDHVGIVVSEAEVLHEKLTAHLKNSINKMFDEISVDVIEYFNHLEQVHSVFKNPRLKLITGKDKAVELEIEFASELVSPAYKVLSESQINSFGLSIFLAAVKHFNCDFKFFMLDDVINSFDNHKRPLVASLIASKFKEFQSLILTHDEVFYETLIRHVPNWNKYHFTNWDFATGPVQKVAKGAIEEIQTLLDDDHANDAGMKLGKYLEWTIGTLNENLKVAVPFKRLNNHTLADLYNPFSNKLKKQIAVANKVHKIQSLLLELDNQTGFRNYCVHWKDVASPHSKTEIQAIFDCWLKIEAIIYCENCNTFVSVVSVSSKDVLRCNCAILNLGDDTFYSSSK